MRARLMGAGCTVTATVIMLLLGGYLAWANRLSPAPTEPPLPAVNGYPLLLLAASHLQPNLGRDRETAVLRELHNAIRPPAVVPNAPEDRDLRALPALQGASTVFAAEAVQLRGAGRNRAAVDTGLDAVELGARIAGGYQDACFIGLFCAKEGRRAARPSIPALSAAEADALGRRADRITAEFRSSGDVVDAMERAAVRSYRGSLTDRPELELWWGTAGERFGSLWENVRWLFRPKPPRYAARRALWDRCRLRFSRPYPAQNVGAGAGAAGLSADFVYERLSLLFSRETAYARLFRLQLALQQFRCVHGSFPRALSELDGSVPGATSTDPFTERPLIYRREGEGYVLYSLGPDGKDDGGRPIGLTGWSGSSPQGPNGDIVARASVCGIGRHATVALTGPE